MLKIVAEVLLPALKGRDVGCRVRVKPSWSGRVYGTYAIRGRHLVLGCAFALSTAALYGNLVALNLASVSASEELAGLHRAAARQVTMRDVAYPGRRQTIARRTDALAVRAREIERILGVTADDEHLAGLGTMEAELTGAPGRTERRTLRALDGETAALVERFRRLSFELTTREDELRFTPSVVPLREGEFVVTSSYGRRISPFTGLFERHRGIDLAADTHSPISATADGVVQVLHRDARASGMGKYVVIDHDGRYQTYYGHCSRLLVEEGQVVRRHQIIAEVGSTGRSTGPHVHYEIRRSGQPLDPRDFMMLDPRFGADAYIGFHAP